MVGNIRNNLFPLLIALTAISVSASAAYYSISGLSKLFAGAANAVIVMASSLEFAKLVIATVLYQFWGKLSKLLKIYLVGAIITLVTITSIGTYGFLSAAYKETYKELAVRDNTHKFLTGKLRFFEEEVARHSAELEVTTKNISTLSGIRATQVQSRQQDGTIQTGLSTAELRIAQQRIDVEEKNRRDIVYRRNEASDSVQYYVNKILLLENESAVSGELGPLQYISSLTGVSMDRVVNWLMLLIVFVFDPLAISLVIVANFAFSKKSNTLFAEESFEKEEKSLEDVPKNDSLPDSQPSEVKPKYQFLRRLQRGPSKSRMLKEDGSQEWVKNSDLRKD